MGEELYKYTPDLRTAFQYSTDDGVTWLPLPLDGAPQGAVNRVRLVWPSDFGLKDADYIWSVRAWDGFEFGTSSDPYELTVARSYTISGQLQDNTGVGLNDRFVRLYVNGVDTGDTFETDTISSVDGRFDLVTTEELKVGDVLWLYVDGHTEKAAAVLHFPGQDVTYDGDSEDIILRAERTYLYGTVPGRVFSNDSFEITSADADIPWTYSTGTVTFKSSLDGSGDGVHLLGSWDLSGPVDGTTSLDTELTVSATGRLRTLAHNLSFHKLTNSGTVEVSSGSRLTIDGANSTSSGTLIVRDGKLRLQKSGGLSLTVDDGVCELVRAELDVNTGDASSLIIDSGTSMLAVLSATGCTFSKFGVVIETDGLCAAFDNNTFDAGISTRHIHWKTTDNRSTGVMRGIDFDYSFGGGSYNVEAASNAVALTMIGCGGVRSGSSYESDSGSKVTWELVAPKGLRIAVGDTRLRLEWDATSQASLSGAGYNVYRSTDPDASLPWGSPLNGGTPLTTTSYVSESLSNGTVYYFYVTVDTTTETESTGSNRVYAAPCAASIDAVSPAQAAVTSIVAVTVFGAKTHWDGTTSLTISGGAGATLNDYVGISPTLILADFTFAAGSAGTRTLQTITNDVWSIGAYDEDETISFDVNDDAEDESERPTLVFNTNNGGMAEGDNVAGSSGTSPFTFNIDFTDQGGGVDEGTLEIYASRDVTISTAVKTAGMELRGEGLNIDTLTSSVATCSIGQTSGTELFSNGEYTLRARVKDDNGFYSEWATRTFYVAGAGTDVLKCSTLLIQGSTMNATLTGTSLSSTQTISFGSDITVNSASGSGSSITVNVTVGHLATCGPRTITTNNGSKSGVAVVEYPTNILPTTTNAEPSRNPGIVGVNVFLKNGAFFKSETDLAVRGRMMGISWSRFYRSDIGFNGPLGNGWVGHYYQRAVFDTGSSDIHWYTPDGRKEVFPDVTGGFSSPVGVYVVATRETTHNTITLTDRHGYRCVFDKDGRLWRCIDRNGNKTECTYNYAGQLITITNDLGETFTVAYHAHGRVDTVSDNMWNDGSSGHTAARQVEYEYSTAGDLTEQKAPTTARYDGTPLARITYGYAYDAAHRLIRCINPREFAQGSNPAAYLENTYDDSSRVTDQKLGDEADVVDGHVSKSAFIRLRYESSTLIRELDRNSLRTDYTIDATGRTTDVKRYTGFYSVDTDFPYTHSTVSSILSKLRAGDPSYFQTVFTYNSNHEILTVTYPRGNKVTYTYPNGSSQAAATANSCSGAVLTDSSEAWGTNAFAGMTLRMGTNAGNYRYYPIASNTSTTITVGTGYSLSGDGWNADAYAVYDQSNDPMAAGNVLTVTRSDESLGSLSDIVSTYTYEPRYNFVKTVKDPRNNTSTYTYDYEESAANGADAGNLVAVSTPTVTGSMASSAAITTRTTYNEYGQPVAMVDGEGNVTRFTYHSTGSQTGFLKFRIAAWGELDLTTEYEYDPVGNLTSSWPPRAFEAGVTKDDFKASFEVNELNQTWHSSHKVDVGAYGSLTLSTVDSYSYFDANGNLTNSFREYITDAASSPSAPGDVLDPTTFSKSSSAMAATWAESSATYNLLNHTVTSTVDAIAGSTITQYTSRVVYDSNYNVRDSITPLGNRSRTLYDERDMVYQRIAGADSDVAGTFASNYDANGNLTSSVDALGNTTTYVYDGFDRTTKVTDAAGHYRETDYDANSNVTESRAFDSLGVLLAKSQTTYDEINRGYTSRRLANDHLGNPIGDGWATGSNVLDKNSRTVSSTNDNGVTSYMFYDGANRVRLTRDAVGNEVEPVYNAHGVAVRTNYREVNQLTSAVEISHTEVDITRQDTVIRSKDRRWNSGFDTSTKVKYDGWGRVTLRTDAGATTVAYTYDLLSRTTDTLEEAGTDDIYTRMVYDAQSRVTTRAIKRNPADSTWQETTYAFDERSRLITHRRPDAGTTGDIWTYRYDANGNRIGWTDPLGTTVTDTYDARNLIAYRNIARGTGVKGATYESYEFDGLGRLQSCSNYRGADLMVGSHWYYDTLSLPERYDQTICRVDGSVFGTYTMKAEYDGAGFRRATVFWDDRRVEHTPDVLDRLLESFDVTNNLSIGVYQYAGPTRLIERTFGNGVRTTYTYEASGCGCGGSTSFCERIASARVSDGEVLWSNDRKYDLRGLVTAEKRDHFGEMGKVFRYDEAERLTTFYNGVDLASTNFATFADSSNPANVPNTDEFSVLRTYNLDPRGNRTGATGIRDTDSASSPTTIRDYAYTPHIDTNQYTNVDGQSYTYDEIEQQLTDPTTGDYLAYDYRGLLYGKDDDAPSSPLGSPYMVNTHDCLGRLCLTEYFHDTLGEEEIKAFVNDVASTSCGCNNPGAPPAGEVNGGGGAVATMVEKEYTYGPDHGVVRSGSARNPLAAPVSMPGGRREGASLILEWINVVGGGSEYPLWHSRDQLDSLGCMTDAQGKVTSLYDYDVFGTPYPMPIYIQFSKAQVSNAAHNSPSANQSTITVSGVSLDTDELRGLELVVALPGDSNDRYRTGRILGNTSTTIVVADASTYDIAAALYSGGALRGFAVMDFRDHWMAPEPYTVAAVSYDGLNDLTVVDATGTAFSNVTTGWVSNGAAFDAVVYDKVDSDTIRFEGNIVPNFPVSAELVARHPTFEYTKGGEWTSTPSYSSGETTFTDSNALFADYMLGWTLMPNAERPSYFTITDVTATTLKVEGDANYATIATSGHTYRVIAPAGIQRNTGALANIGSEGEVTWNPQDRGPSNLWAGYRHVPAMAGWYDEGETTTTGAQSGWNLTGTYHCLNRQYDPWTGRWTTPDPAARPWRNLWDYCGDKPTQTSDPTGLLFGLFGRNWIWSDEVKKAKQAEEDAKAKAEAWGRQDSGCTICVHSNSRTEAAGGNGIEGHAWITLWCDTWGDQSRDGLKTYGTWPDGGNDCGGFSMHGRLKEDGSEKAMGKYGYGIGHYYRCRKVSNKEFLAFRDAVKKLRDKDDDAWSPMNTCATSAAALATAAGLDIAENIYPRKISNAIFEKNGASEKSDINPFGKSGKDWKGGLEEAEAAKHTNPSKGSGPSGLVE